MTCLIKDCARIKKGTRGLCQDHYQVAVRRVRQGKTTWDELEKYGLAEPSRRTERGGLSMTFDSALSDKRLVNGRKQINY